MNPFYSSVQHLSVQFLYILIFHPLYLFSLFQTRLEAQSTESYVTVSTLQAEKLELIQIKDSIMKYVRELEQINDDLERGKRYKNHLITYLVLYH